MTVMDADESTDEEQELLLQLLLLLQVMVRVLLLLVLVDVARGAEPTRCDIGTIDFFFEDLLRSRSVQCDNAKSVFLSLRLELCEY